ncbi:MAG: XRE family transcriptional regulator [Lactobacillus iners]|uniref:LexA family transcriptional regulator n=1 Tax=Lactobacillus iners TaxID=147802 RepID=UPI001F09AB21|nr:XRE family transcriptional regulator [Lactobacillus iners]MCT7783424.1 XRE family transcriptional regulator [Lactobacillus iners]MCT7857155.1 XRE family transcriptional regulator [Lactobacillus iners]
MALGNKEIFSQNLKYYMYKYGVDRNALCDTLGFKYMTVSDWINAKTYPRIDKIEILANYFNIKKSDLVEKQTDKQIDISPVYNQLTDIRKHKVYSYAQQQLDEQNSNLNEKRSIYLVGSSAAGLPLDYGDLDAELIDLSNIPKKADKAIHIKGDSMEPKIANNSIIFYHEQPTLEIGEIGIFEINGSAVTCKKYYVDYESKKIVLKSINPKYEPMYFAGDQVRILGKVVF